MVGCLPGAADGHVVRVARRLAVDRRRAALFRQHTVEGRPAVIRTRTLAVDALGLGRSTPHGNARAVGTPRPCMSDARLEVGQRGLARFLTPDTQQAVQMPPHRAAPRAEPPTTR